ncbi:unnamed protein product [Symbiodinium natans]|uniref:Uncharacterized protein n=1 Tax=Symbiodinium natans TaxID=878477 RepID=A0A812MFQ0_9DINO|nr:unnamed protein product [Symbiodinium natans]
MALPQFPLPCLLHFVPLFLAGIAFASGDSHLCLDALGGGVSFLQASKKLWAAPTSTSSLSTDSPANITNASSESSVAAPTSTSSLSTDSPANVTNASSQSSEAAPTATSSLSTESLGNVTNASSESNEGNVSNVSTDMKVPVDITEGVNFSEIEDFGGEVQSETPSAPYSETNSTQEAEPIPLIQPVKDAVPLPDLDAENLTGDLRDCIMGSWSEWSECRKAAKKGGSGLKGPHQIRQREIIQPWLPNGAPCGSQSEARECEVEHHP